MRTQLQNAIHAISVPADNMFEFCAAVIQKISAPKIDILMFIEVRRSLVSILCELYSLACKIDTMFMFNEK
jgi:hypothetical protein